MDWVSRYASLLLDYSLALVSGETLYVRSTPQALPLIEAIQRQALQRGARVLIALSNATLDKQLIELGNETAWDIASQPYTTVVNQFDCMLTILAPENTRDASGISSDQVRRHGEWSSNLRQVWSERSASGAFRWCLCVYPTAGLAQEAGMSSADFVQFVTHACGLDADPIAYWQGVHAEQAVMVSRLNQAHIIRYRSPNMDISFSVSGRRWINSDGRRNMPSGEVFTSPIETSGNGWVRFDYPLLYQGDELKDVRFDVKNGEITHWTAAVGQSVLDRLMAFPGARIFGEIAIGTNRRIQRHTQNILFDEKMGGTIHMAIGQSYFETGGKNQSPIHLDFIASMMDGSIELDDELVYSNGDWIKGGDPT